MLAAFDQQLANTLAEIRSQGLYKTERIITSPQDARIEITGGRRVLNMCANNYLGLADHPALIAAAKEALDTHGFGMASVRFICGTQDIHKDLEGSLTKFLGTDDTILYPSAFDANGGLFETLLGAEDAVISDELNHASIIDGIRLCKAQRFRYKNNDMADLEAKLIEARDARVRLIATDGCFSMDGTIAELGAICDLAEKYQALTMIDDAHASGFLGKHRTRHARIPRSDGKDRHHHRDAWESARGGKRRFHQRPETNYRIAPPTIASLPFFKHRRSADRRRVHQSARAADRFHRVAGQTGRKHQILSRSPD